MPTVNDYFAGGEGQSEAIATIIGFKSVSITIDRDGVTLPAQTVRLETLSGQRQVQGQGGMVYLIDAMVLGYKGHPTLADTDIKPGDRFSVNGQHFEVIAIAPGHIDNVTAYLKLRG